MSRQRFGILAIAVLLLAGAGFAVVARQGAGATGEVDPVAAGTLFFVDESSKRVGQVSMADPGGTAVLSGLSCLRVYSAGGTTVCLRAVALPPSFEALVLGPDLRPIRTIKLDGIPSRVRVSRSGRLIGWTVFRTGDSYLPAGYFSTTTGIYDRSTNTLIGSLEDFPSVVDGANPWGITFADDDRTFYATLASAGKNHLIRGDIRDRTLTVVRDGVECPSLSPDGKRIAYKGEGWWLHVLDLASGKDIALATRSRWTIRRRGWTTRPWCTPGPRRTACPLRCTRCRPTGPGILGCCANARSHRRPSASQSSGPRSVHSRRRAA